MNRRILISGFPPARDVRRRTSVLSCGYTFLTLIYTDRIYTLGVCLTPVIWDAILVHMGSSRLVTPCLIKRYKYSRNRYDQEDSAHDQIHSFPPLAQYRTFVYIQIWCSEPCNQSIIVLWYVCLLLVWTSPSSRVLLKSADCLSRRLQKSEINTPITIDNQGIHLPQPLQVGLSDPFSWYDINPPFF